MFVADLFRTDPFITGHVFNRPHSYLSDQFISDHFITDQFITDPFIRDQFTTDLYTPDHIHSPTAVPAGVPD